MAPGLFQLMRKHWKKSIFFSTLTTFSLNYTYDYLITHDVMKRNCRKAAVLGDKKLSSTTRPRHVTVILNPVAGKRKSKKLYTKWVEPLLHLAGIKVSLVETERPNQAYDLMRIMADCDGVAIVGGDGTIHEALNGLLHRPDSSKAVKDLPIALIPTGLYNSIARYIHQGLSYRNQKEFLIESTMRLVNSCTEQHDVLKILSLNEEDRNEPIYALRDLRYGKYQDNFFKTSGSFFYQSAIKPYLLRLQKIFKNNCPTPDIESIIYTKPCGGCSKCYSKHLLNDVQSMNEVQSANSRWWSKLAPPVKSTISEEEQRQLESSKVVNLMCDERHEILVVNEISDFRASMMGDKKVRLSLARHGDYNLEEVLEAQDIQLKLSKTLDHEKRLADSKKMEELSTSNSIEQDNKGEQDIKKKEQDIKKEDKEKLEIDGSTKFLIDGQPIQAHSLNITTLYKTLTIFTGHNKIF